MSVDALFCVCIDPWGEPKGGQARFAKQMLHAFGDRLAVAGITNEDLPLRRWIDRRFEGNVIKFFNMGKIQQKNGTKPIIPLRLVVYHYAKISMPIIHSTGVKSLFIESPEVLFAAANYKWNSVCYRFAGVSNPVANSRYKWARLFGAIFERKLFSDLNKINVDSILASADYKAIEELVARSKGQINRSLIHHFPTRIDTSLFQPFSKEEKRKALNLEKNKTIIVSCGRLSWLKGWDLILDSLVCLQKSGQDFQVIFVGDGEDRSKLFQKAKELKIEKNILVTGFIPNSEVQSYLDAADLCVVASQKEGWSLAMLEMLACGKAIVSTDVSGADAMIRSGHNGFIVKERNPTLFADAITKALKLKNAKEVSLEIAARYSTKTIVFDLGLLWQPLSDKHKDNNCERLAQ
jgi:glycosyltransferase involved in cell wall biosynthesis